MPKQSPILIAGPCTLESLELGRMVAYEMAELCQTLGFNYIFKASFDKANRTQGNSRRGPGLERGLPWLQRIKDEVGVAVLTDVHHPEQCAPVASVVDVVQTPAFLCRQTDLLLAAGQTKTIVNWKKGQFLDPALVPHAVDKLLEAGASEVWVTERGTTFGHGDLVVDFRGFAPMRAAADKLVFDATHSAQRPAGGTTTGRREDALDLAKAAVALGVDALFMEVHPTPQQAWSDAATQQALGDMPRILQTLKPLWEAGRQAIDK